MFATQAALAIRNADLYDRAQQEIKNAVDGISTFPVETEKPIVARIVLVNNVMKVAVTGETDERSLKAVAQRVRERRGGLGSRGAGSEAADPVQPQASRGRLQDRLPVLPFCGRTIRRCRHANGVRLHGVPSDPPGKEQT